MFNARFAETFLLGGVTDDVQHVAEERWVRLGHFLDQVFAEIDDYIVGSGAMQLLGHMAAGVSKAEEDVVSSEFADSFLHSASPKRISDFDFHQEGGHYGKHVDGYRHTEQDHSHVENPQSGVMSGVNNLGI